MNDISTIPTAYCGKKARYKNFQKGFYKFCDDYIINKKNTCNVCHEMYYKNRTNKTKSTLIKRTKTPGFRESAKTGVLAL